MIIIYLTCVGHDDTNFSSFVENFRNVLRVCAITGEGCGEGALFGSTVVYSALENCVWCTVSQKLTRSYYGYCQNGYALRAGITQQTRIN